MKKIFIFSSITLLSMAMLGSCKINKSLNETAKKESAQKQQTDQNIKNIQKAEQETQRGQPMRE
ncbi:MAG TPA: hypothetical protein PKX92_11645 [Edaphocola sp.]|nr:hypothetical protein [Edaphocola sp.]